MSKTEKRDIQKEITDRIIAALERGPDAFVLPWRKFAASGMPRNGATGRIYSGMNVLILAFSGFTDCRWYTFNQAKSKGGSVRKGEKGTPVVYWNFIEKVDEVTGKKEKIPFLRTFTVFNRDQIEGLKDEQIPAVDPTLGYEKVAELVKILEVEVSHGGDIASYSIALDRIKMPKPGQFESVEKYWLTLLHEITHWTGHSSRLDRQFGKRFGDDAYAFEELVAEMGSAMAAASLGMNYSMCHEGYINHWLKVLKGDKYAIFTAAREAQRAVTLMTEAIAPEESETIDEETEAVDLASAA